MRRRSIPATDLVCSVIALGGVPLGSMLTESDSFQLMDAYLDGGGNMVDTALVYANWLPGEKSVSETTIGKWMKSRGNRSELIVTTKGGHPELSSMNVARLDRESLETDIESSLRRLQVDAIDLYWLHRDDPDRPVSDMVDSLNAQVKAGNIRYFGCSNWSAARIAEAQDYAEKNGLQGFSANQPWWSLADVDQSAVPDRTLVLMDDKLQQFHLENGMAVFAYSSQAQGLFTKLEKKVYGSIDDEGVPAKYRLPANTRKYESAKALAAELSVPISRIALAYLLAQPFPTFPIAGCRTMDQLEDCLQAAEIALTPEQLGRLA